jgi:hypothetical protein
MKIIKQHLLSILSVLLLLFCVNFSALSQDRKEKFQLSYKSRIDLSVFVFPYKEGFSQKYQLSTNFSLKGRYGFGVSMSYFSFDPKYDFSGNSIGYRFSLGPSMELLDLKWVNLMTYTHVLYTNMIHPNYSTIYYGGGVLQGMRLDFRLGQFGIGIRTDINITYGMVRNINFPNGKWVYDASWGNRLNLTYFISK